MSDLIQYDAMRNRLIELATNAVDSPKSQNNYRIALNEFLDWHESHNRPALDKALINTYKQYLIERGLSSSSVNLKLSAIRKLVSEAADIGLIDQIHANGIKAVKGVKSEGTRTGNWLTKAQAQQLLNSPDTNTLKGKRDQAILALFLFSGLRLEELSKLTVEHLQERDNRWVIVDLIGKRGKVRSVPISAVCKSAIDTWLSAAGIESGELWRTLRRGNHIDQTGLSERAIWKTVQQYACQCGFPEISPHDLRRTYAKLAYKAGCSVEQISINLGHSSIRTTQLYLGIDLDLENSPSDYIDLQIE